MLRAMAELHRVSTPKFVARNIARNIAAVESRPTSATLRATNFFVYPPSAAFRAIVRCKFQCSANPGGRGQLCLRSHAIAHPMMLTIITSLVSRSVKFQWPPKDDTRKVLHLMITQRI